MLVREVKVDIRWCAQVGMTPQIVVGNRHDAGFALDRNRISSNTRGSFDLSNKRSSTPHITCTLLPYKPEDALHS
jgi:hypothetical protein